MTVIDAFGVQLTLEEEDQFTDDLWEAGIPPTKETITWLWERWGLRMGIPRPRTVMLTGSQGDPHGKADSGSRAVEGSIPSGSTNTFRSGP